MPVRRRLLAALLAACIAMPSARAEPAAGNDARARELMNRGHALMDAKRYADALAAYDEAYALGQDPALFYNRGRALQFLARYPEALDAIERFSTQAPRELRARVPGLPELLRDLQGRVGTLVVASSVGGARVMVNDRNAGTTPLSAPLRLNAGHVAVDAFAEGYFPFHREIDLPGGAQVEIALALVSRQSSGVLAVKSHVGGTRVDLDGHPAGVAPLEIGVRPGAHRADANREGHDGVFTQVIVGAGERKEVWLDPTSRPPIYAKWWFWTAIGVVVAAGAVTVIALTTEKRPSGGDYSPGVVRF